MPELIKIASLIQAKITLLAKGRTIIKERAIEKARSSSKYDKELALTIIRLKNGEKLELEDKTIENPVATISEKIAKGIVWEFKLENEKAEALYKASITNMNSLTTEVNALQSLLRIMDEVEG